MSITFLWELLRYVSSAAAFVSAVLWIMTCIAEWREIPRRFRLTCPWIGLLLLILTYAAVEAAQLHASGGLRLLLIPLSLCGLGASLAFGFIPSSDDE